MDYVRDAGEAEKVKEQYKLNSATDKNLVIFDCDGHVKIVPGDALTQFKLEQVPNATEREFRRKPVAFNGEMMFTSMLLALENPKPLKAYFLQGHGEPSLTDSGDSGYLKFGAILAENYIADRILNCSATTPCRMIATCSSSPARATAFSDAELQKIDQYLDARRTAVHAVQLFFHQASDRPRTHPAALGRQCRAPTSCRTRRTPLPARMRLSAISVQHPVVNPLTHSRCN